jgi:type I restriction enzyme R subunit
VVLTDVNREDRLVQCTLAEYLEKALGGESIYAFNAETFGPAGTLGRASEREVAPVQYLLAAVARLMLSIQDFARDRAIEDGPTVRDLLLPRLMSRDIAV